MATSTKTLFSFCSLLMSALFAYSASVQLNDPDWYFWFPLYCCACVVNLINWAVYPQNIIRQIAKRTLWLGVFLLLKVIMEDFASGTAGLWSLDISERVVREKTGSGLVVISMILHLQATSSASEPKHPVSRRKHEFPKYIAYGMAILVCFSFVLPFVFFVVRDGEMKFDHVKE